LKVLSLRPEGDSRALDITEGQPLYIDGHLPNVRIENEESRNAPPSIKRLLSGVKAWFTSESDYQPNASVLYTGTMNIH
jgi:hypothetical protein